MQVITVREIFARMKSNFLPEAAGDLKATVAYVLNGDGGGAWTLKVADAQVEITEGLESRADATVSAGADDFVKVVLGQLNPVSALMTGKVRIEGDPFLVQKCLGLFRQPKTS